MSEKRRYTVQELQEILGVSRSMINKWADKGKFTVIKVGSRVRIRRDEFEDWMEKMCCWYSRQIIRRILRSVF